MSRIQTHKFSGDCTDSCKSNYHTITTTTIAVLIIKDLDISEYERKSIGNLSKKLKVNQYFALTPNRLKSDISMMKPH